MRIDYKNCNIFVLASSIKYINQKKINHENQLKHNEN